MSQAENAGTSSSTKRAYRKGNPLTASERKQSSLAKKRETHKEISVFVPNDLKEQLSEFCAEDGVTQAKMVEFLISSEAIRRKGK
ncbi:replication regulatory protein RepA [Erwinia aphidicola]|nr:replication regulatory protein RepA [Erwinia aphidicola]